MLQQGNNFILFSYLRRGIYHENNIGMGDMATGGKNEKGERKKGRKLYKKTG